MPSNYQVEVKGRASCKRYIKFGNVTGAFKLYTSTDEVKSAFNKGCSLCLEKIKAPSVCINETCENHNQHLEATEKIYVDNGVPIRIPPEDLETLMIPSVNEKGQEIMVPLPDQEYIIVHSRLNEKQAYSMLNRATDKYYLTPDSKNSANVYAVLLASMLKTKQALMVKFCLTSPKQNLGLIVEDEGQLVLCVIPYAKAFRPQPEFKLDTQVNQTIVEAVYESFKEFPVASYEDAQDDYQIALDYYLENLLKDAAAKRGEAPKEVVSDKMVELNLTRKKATPKQSREVSMASGKKEKVPA